MVGYTYRYKWQKEALSNLHLSLEATPDSDIQVNEEGLESSEIPRVQVTILNLLGIAR